MIKKLAVKARQRIGALSRVRHLLNSENLKMIYTMFIRSIMEYQSTAWVGTAQSHLDKLDRIQRRAEMIGSFTVEPLQARRDAAAMSFALKLLDGGARGELKNFIPRLIEPMRLCKKRTRQSLEGIQIESKVRPKSLDVYRRGFQGVLPIIWSRIPMDIITRGESIGWRKIKSACTNFLTGRETPMQLKKRKVTENQDGNNCKSK